jgi:hypothetical protein
LGVPRLRDIEFTVRDSIGIRKLVVPAGEPSCVGDPIGLLLDLEARTGTRLRDGGNPAWFLRLHKDFQERQDHQDSATFADYANSRHPDGIEVVGDVHVTPSPHCPLSWAFGALCLEYVVIILGPSDTEDDKQAVRSAVDQVNEQMSICGNSVRFRCRDWHSVPAAVDGRDPQQHITANLLGEGRWQVAVVLLRKRYGTPTPRADSGTEEEITEALGQVRKSGGRKALLCFLHTQAPAAGDCRNEEQEQKIIQLQRRLQRQGVLKDYNDARDLQNGVSLELFTIAHRPFPAQKEPLTSRPRASTHVLRAVIDARHLVWKDLQAFLSSQQCEIRVLDRTITTDDLVSVHVLIETSRGHGGGWGFTGSECDAIAQYVESGGALIVSGQAWSWVSKSYGNKLLSNFPLNQLGSRLGFEIQSAPADPPRTWEGELAVSVQTIRREGWVPSRIVAGRQPLDFEMRDQRSRLIAAAYPWHSGWVAVFGHESILEQNRGLLAVMLEHIREPLST